MATWESPCLKKKDFASSDPRHGIQFIPSDILSGKSSGILFGILFEILSGIPSDILSSISSDILSGILFGILFGILYDFVSRRWGPVEVRRGPRRAESRRLKSGEAHCDQELADEVRRRPLRSRAGRWGPARRRRRRRRRSRRRSRASDIKSNNPHLAGGEKRILK